MEVRADIAKKMDITNRRPSLAKNVMSCKRDRCDVVAINLEAFRTLNGYRTTER